MPKVLSPAASGLSYHAHCCATSHSLAPTFALFRAKLSKLDWLTTNLKHDCLYGSLVEGEGPKGKLGGCRWEGGTQRMMSGCCCWIVDGSKVALKKLESRNHWVGSPKWGRRSRPGLGSGCCLKEQPIQSSALGGAVLLLVGSFTAESTLVAKVYVGCLWKIANANIPISWFMVKWFDFEKNCLRCHHSNYHRRCYQLEKNWHH